MLLLLELEKPTNGKTACERQEEEREEGQKEGGKEEGADIWRWDEVERKEQVRWGQEKTMQCHYA